MARSIVFSLSKSSRLIGFWSSKNSSFGFCSSSCSVPSPTPSREKRAVLPWLMLAPETNGYKFYRLSEKDVKKVVVESDPPPDADSHCLQQSYQGWISYIRRKDCQVFLFNPLSGKKIILPSVETLPSIKGVIRNSQTGLVESFISEFSPEPHPPESCSYGGIISDVVLSSSPMDDDCIAVVSYGVRGKLAFCRIRHDEEEDPNYRWIPLDSPFTDCRQIIYHSGKKLFYTLSDFKNEFEPSDFKNEFEAWDLHSDPMNRFHVEDQTPKGIYDWAPILEDKDLFDNYDETNWYKLHYLLYDHQSQELFLVIRHVLNNANVEYHHRVPHIIDPDLITHKTVTFDVYKVDFIKDDLIKVQYLEDSIGNRAFFLGKKRGFVLSTIEFPELRPGSIYFADNKYQWQYNFAGHDMGIYDYEENSIIGKLESISPASSWFIPDGGADADV
ncbi:unnamed protein product [Withania somnifera]